MALQSFYGQLLTAIQDRIRAAVPEVKWTDQDLGQLEADTDRPPVLFPCVLIDFNGSQYADLSYGVQQATNCVVQMRLAFAPYSSSSGATPTPQRELALQYYEIENKLFKAFNNWEPAGEICQAFSRTADATERRDDSLRVRVLLWSTAFEDYTAHTVPDRVPAAMVITVE